MNTTIKIPWLKIIGWAVLIHVILIAISILEVFLYSILINPGQENVFYEQHAKLTAPYVSIIFGIILFFFVARFLAKNRQENKTRIGLALPLVYIITDVIILEVSQVDWGEHLLVFIISFVTKLMAGYIGAIGVGGNGKHQEVEVDKDL